MATDILDELLKLPSETRFEIAMALWESLSDAAIEADPALSPEQRAEVRLRLIELEAAPDSAVPWEAVVARHSTVSRRNIEGSR